MAAERFRVTITESPPAWAEALLRAALRADDFACVSGDLVEEYRETVYGARGPHGADLWYARQVFSFVWRRAAIFAGLFALAFIARTALDWRMPAADYHARSAISTGVAFLILLVVGYGSGSRSRSFASGALIGTATVVLSIPLQLAGVLSLFAVWHDPVTAHAIDSSGGLSEVLSFPLITLIPAVALTTMGGWLGAGAARLSTRRVTDFRVRA